MSGISLLVSGAFTFLVIMALARLVIDFPAFTKAIFCAVSHAHEHTPSRREMLRLLMLPSSLCVAVLADGMISAVGLALGAVYLYQLVATYELRRLNSLIRHIMRMRANLEFVAPQAETRKLNGKGLWLIVGAFIGSGWLRGGYTNLLIEPGIGWLSQQCHNFVVQQQLPSVICLVTPAVTRLLILGAVTFLVISVMSRLILDFPAFTRSVFWAVTRSYEHKPSRRETLRLVMLPSALCVAVLANGQISLAALALSIWYLRYLLKNYQIRRFDPPTHSIQKLKPQVRLDLSQEESVEASEDI